MLYKFSTLLFLLINFIACASNQDLKDQCRICRSMVKSFMEGLDKTVMHFGGGDTDWEEKKLVKFKISETRFVEVMEHICHSDDKESRFKCHSMAERNEELLEKWFFEHQDDDYDLENFLCVDELKYCCAQGHFGPDCAACPGMKLSGQACFGRGGCDGVGTRVGTGACSCWLGYVGKMCSNCDANYFAVEQNATSIKCKVCFPGCTGGCQGEGPRACRACSSGYIMDEEEGCKDIDECATGEKCVKSNERCVNTEGSFRCECAEGFKRMTTTTDGEEECELDVEAAPALPWLGLGTVPLLRLTAYSSLSLISLFIFSTMQNRTPVVIGLNVLAILLVLLIDFYWDGAGGGDGIFANLFNRGRQGRVIRGGSGRS